MNIEDEAFAFLASFKRQLEAREIRNTREQLPFVGVQSREASFQAQLAARPGEQVFQPENRRGESALPEVSLACDSIAVSKTKCGYSEFSPFVSTPPKKYLTKTLFEKSENFQKCPPPSGPCTRTHLGQIDAVGDYDPITCVETILGTLHIADDPCGGTPSSSTGAYNSFTGETGMTATSATLLEYHVTDSNPCPTGTSDKTYTLSNEYTTDALIENVEAAMPEYDNDWDDDCFASRTLPSNELSYSIQRLRYKHVLSDAPSNDVVVSWIQRFTPGDGSPVTDTPMSTTITAGNTESAVFERDEPADNGTYTIIDVEVAWAP